VHIGTSSVGYMPSKMRIEIADCNFFENKIDIPAEYRTTSASAPPFLRGGAVSIATDCPTNITITRTIFRGNMIQLRHLKSHAVFGGAVDIDAQHPDSTTLVTDCDFERNSAHAGRAVGDDASAGLCGGGAFNAFVNHPVTIQNCSFRENICQGSSGGLYATFFAQLRLPV
jgi:hypothetical protein